MLLQNKIANFASVTKLDRHIEILLLDNDCVIVPGLGGFVAHHVSARYDEQDGLFLPPYRTLGFNAQLTMNDSLLAQSYVDAYDMSYPEALRQIENEVNEIYHTLENEGLVELYDLGRLARNSEGKLEFEPFESGILTPMYYGLSSFEAPQINEVSESNHATLALSDAQERKSRIIYIDNSDKENKRLSISLHAVRSAAAAAVFLTAVFLVGFPSSTRNGTSEHQIKSGMLYNLFDSSDTSNTSVHFKPLRAIATSVNAPVKEEAAHHSHYWAIVVASHVTELNARTYVKRMQKKGLDDARVYEGTESIKVLYGYYASQREAREKLNAMHGKTFFKNAWIIEIDK